MTGGWGSLAAALLAAAGTTWVLTAGMLPLLRHHEVLDHPDERRSHQQPTPRGGGLAFVAVHASYVAWYQPTAHWRVLLVALLATAVLGLLEDLRGVPAVLRLLIHAAVAGGVAAWLVPGDPGSGWWVIVAVVGVGLVWLLNLYNFMDGIDGIAGWQGVFAAGLLGVLYLDAGDQALAMAALVLAAAVGGFLPWNWPRARVFMGDVGSTTLGFLLGLLVLLGVARGTGSPWWAPLLLAVFVVDATATLALRLVEGERWYTPHRRHTYQLLVAQGASHASVVLRYMLINLVLVAPLAWWTRGSVEIQGLACIALYLVLGLVWWVARRT